MKRPRRLLRYGVVPPAVATALVIHWWLLGTEPPFMLLWPIVLSCAWYGGMGPGLLATALSVLGAASFLLAPRFSLAVTRPSEVVGLVVFAFVSVSISLLNEKVHRSAALAERQAAELARRREEETARLHFQTLFESSPGLFLVLKPDWTIVAVSDAYLAATMTKRKEILGRGLFDVFPDNPDDSGATGVSNLRASLNRVLQSRAPDAMAVQKYDIRRPESAGGGFEERYWSPVNSPVRGPDGQIAYLIHRVEDVTEFVRQKEASAQRDSAARAWRIQSERMEAEVFLRGQELHQLNEQLWRANQALATEVAERQRREEGLRQSEERFRILVEGVQDYAIFLLDTEGRVASWNTGAERIKGYRAEEIIGQHFSRFYPAEPLARGFPSEELRRATAEGRFEDEGWRLRKDGSRFWANVIITALWDGDRLRGFSKVTRDLTERRQREEELRQLSRDLEKRFAERTASLAASNEALRREAEERGQAEQALRESEGRFRATFEQAAVGIAHVGLDGQWLRVNHRLCEITGYTHEELLGLTFQDITHPGDLDADLDHVRRLLAGEVATYAMEKRYFGKDRQEIWVNLTASLVRRPGGEPDYFISVIEDVSQRKALEQQVQQYAAELESRVAERTRELQEVNAALESFGYSVSHDLRTPLRNMQSLAQALAEDYADRLEADGRDFCRRIIAAARKMDTLINDLLAYSRLSRSELRLARVDLNGVLAEVQTGLAELLLASSAQVAVEGPLPSVIGHRSTLVQVVTNLLTNAVKFVAPRVQPKVRIWAEDRADCVRLWVEDNGIGIAADHCVRIFNVFERLHGEESYPGTGIGLAIVRKGVERTGGRAGVESEVGKGSRFWVELPRPGGA